MFSAEACGLRLLCEAIGSGAPSLECTETFESPTRKKRRVDVHVSFCDTPCVREYEVDPDSSLWSLATSTDYAAIIVGDDDVDRRLAEAEMNRTRNRRVDRYGTCLPVTQSNRRGRAAFEHRAQKGEGYALARTAPFARAPADDASAQGDQRVYDSRGVA